MKDLHNKSIWFLFLLLLFPVYPVFSQNAKPVAVQDTASTLSEIPVTINLLWNDYDPDGDSIKIMSTPLAHHGYVEKINDSSIIYVSRYYTGIDSFEYRIIDNLGNISDWSYVKINVLKNPVLPYARNDSGSTISCDSLMINVLRNDTDPVGDPLQIDYVGYSAKHDAVLTRVNDSVFLYRSDSQFTGTDTIFYRARKKNNTTLYSNTAKVIVHVGFNPAVPIAFDDTVSYLCYSTKNFAPLLNDIIPTTHSMIISFSYPYPSYVYVNPDQSVTYYDSIWNKTIPIVFTYRIKRKYDQVYSSNTAKIILQYVINPQYFYALPDDLYTNTYRPVSKDLLSNDYNPDPTLLMEIRGCSYSPFADSLRWAGRVLIFYPNKLYEGTDTISYLIGDTNGSYKLAVADVYLHLQNNNAGYLDINNIRARFNSSGLHFLKGVDADFEVPKGSGKMSAFSNSLWVGGKDHLDSLHFAGERYRQGAYNAFPWYYPDYYAGPVTDSADYTKENDSVWNYIWKLSKADIEYHKDHYHEQGYQPIHNILTWPGNGNIGYGQADLLAPFYDNNRNGIYEPMDGDYPHIRGDQALYFIFNDDRSQHKESGGKKLKIEVRGMAYAFEFPGDSAFNNTVFLHYNVINHSEETYIDTYLGVFTDIDLGLGTDDFMGCDVERNIYYGYNGDSVDGDGQSYTYGSGPPAMGVIILAGPKMDDDGIDNPRFDQSGHQLCDESVNGQNFGDTIVDNERFGLKRFISFTNISSNGPSFMRDPSKDYQYYNSLLGFWKDTVHMSYGGLAHPGYGAYGPDCNFIYPGDSDSLNWGVGCMAPNGPVFWTEKTANNIPGDRRGMAACGPFTFKPGDLQEMDIAFSWARAYGSSDPDFSVNRLLEMADIINNAFTLNRLPNGLPFNSVSEKNGPDPNKIKIFPNPASTIINVVYDNRQGKEASVKIISCEGKTIKSQSMINSAFCSINVSDLPAGFYLVQVQSEGNISFSKLIIVK